MIDIVTTLEGLLAQDESTLQADVPLRRKVVKLLRLLLQRTETPLDHVSRLSFM